MYQEKRGIYRIHLQCQGQNELANPSCLYIVVNSKQADEPDFWQKSVHK